MKKIIVLLVLSVLFVSCAHGVPSVSCVSGSEAGFFSGLWHGLITPFSFPLSLFVDDIAVYAVKNTGGWYDFGYLLSIGGLGFGASR